MSHNNEKQSIKWKLKVIFLYYSSYADRNNCKLLKSQNYRRFLIDTETVTQQSAFPAFDIAFRKIHSSSITQPQFLELIPVIAKLLYSKQNRSTAFNIFIHKNIQKLYKQLLEKSQFGAEVNALINIRFDDRSYDLLETVPFQKAYRKYIEATSMHQKNSQQTFQAVYVFLNEFEICPKLVSKAMTYLAFFYLLNDKQDSKRYQIWDLQKMIICIAELSWTKTQGKQASQQQKILAVLQHMEVSEGFKKMVDKSLKQNNMVVSFFKNVPRMVIMQTQIQRLSRSLQKATKSTKKSSIPGQYFSSKPQRKEDYSAIKQIIQLSSPNKYSQLKQLFSKLCSHGQVGNIKTLKSYKLKKFFQSNELLISVTKGPWLDLTITDLCRSSSSGKIQFPQFLQLINLTASRLNIPSQGLIQFLSQIKGRQSPVNRSRYRTQPSYQTAQQHSQVLGVLYQVQKPLFRIFTHFSQNKKLLSFQDLCHLLYQFDVFPSFLSKSKLYQIFQQHASANSQIKHLMGNINLDMHGFVNVLADIAAQTSENMSDLEKVLFLLQKMQDSRGHRELLGRQGTNLICDLRSKYSQVYTYSNKTASKKQANFDQLLNAYSA